MNPHSSSLDLSLNPQAQNATCMIFCGLFQIQLLFDRVLLPLELNTKFIKLRTKFQLKQAKLLLSTCTSSLLPQQSSTAKLPGFFQKFKNSVRALRDNQFKVTLRKTFLFNASELGSEKESKNDEKALFQDFQWCLDLSLNPQAPDATYIRFCGLFQFQQFYCLQNLTLSSLNFSLNCK